MKKLKRNKSYILKPSFGSGSRDVSIIKKISDILKYKKKLNKKNFIIEDFVEGKEFVTDGFVYKGNIFFYYIAEKEKLRKSNFLVCNLYKITTLNNDEENKIKNLISKTLEALTYDNGPFHAEVIYDKSKNKIHIIEIHPRGGGFHIGTRFIEKLTGLDLSQLELDILMDKEKNISEFIPKREFKNFCIRFLPITQDGKLKLVKFKKIKLNKEVHCIKKIFYKKGAIVKKGNHDGARICYVMLFSNNKKINLNRLSEIILKKKLILNYANK